MKRQYLTAALICTLIIVAGPAYAGGKKSGKKAGPKRAAGSRRARGTYVGNPGRARAATRSGKSGAARSAKASASASRMALHTNFQLSGGGKYLAARQTGTSHTTKAISVAMPTTSYGYRAAGRYRQMARSVQYKESDLYFARRSGVQSATTVRGHAEKVRSRKRPGRAFIDQCETPAAPSPLPIPYPNIAQSSQR